MAKNTRTANQRMADLETEARMLREGRQHIEIAAVLGVSRTQVSNDAAKLREMWVEEARSYCSSRCLEAAQKIAEIAFAEWSASHAPVARVRLAAARDLLDRSGLVVRSEDAATERDWAILTRALAKAKDD